MRRPRGRWPTARFGDPEHHLQIVGESRVMQRLRRDILALARTDEPVLIQGETGVGKSLVASVIHCLSPRAKRPLVSFSAANLSESLFESELFGHVRGAFSGAHQDHVGLARAAEGGTLLLDECAELSPINQAKLLHFLDGMEVRPVGGVHAAKVDARVICATNRDLATLADTGAFRRDLYYRLTVMTLHVPSLDQRREDVPLLAAHFLEKFASEHGKPFAGISSEAMELILRREWRGNVRELRNAIRRAVVLTPQGVPIGVDHLAGAAEHRRSDGRRGFLRECREKMEREVILTVIGEHGWNVSSAARELGITRVGLARKLKRLGITRPGTGASS